jgi:hypothetical protein
LLIIPFVQLFHPATDLRPLWTQAGLSRARNRIRTVDLLVVFLCL